jgi:hypothetical protein
MTKCRNCGGYLAQVRRTRWERLICSAAYLCQKCRTRVRERSLPYWWTSTWRFILSRHTVCIRCGTVQVHKVRKRDPLNQFSKHPLSLIQAIFFVPRKECPFCRLQYLDVRPVAHNLQMIQPG